MTRNGVSLALFSVGEMGHRILLLRLSAVLRNAVVMCRPLITPDHCRHKTTWPAFQPSLPPGLIVSLVVLGGVVLFLGGLVALVVCRGINDR